MIYIFSQYIGRHTKSRLVKLLEKNRNQNSYIFLNSARIYNSFKELFSNIQNIKFIFRRIGTSKKYFGYNLNDNDYYEFNKIFLNCEDVKNNTHVKIEDFNNNIIIEKDFFNIDVDFPIGRLCTGGFLAYQYCKKYLQDEITIVNFYQTRLPYDYYKTHDILFEEHYFNDELIPRLYL